MQIITTNAPFRPPPVSFAPNLPLPFVRYTVDYGALKVAAAGNKLVCNTF